MSKEQLIHSLLIELAAIEDGKCIWCRLGRSHPIYSQCPHSKAIKVRERVIGQMEPIRPQLTA